MTKGFSEEFPGCLGVFMECKCAHWILFSHSCVLQPGATGNLTEGGSEVGELREGRGVLLEHPSVRLRVLCLGML